MGRGRIRRKRRKKQEEEKERKNQKTHRGHRLDPGWRATQDAPPAGTAAAQEPFLISDDARQRLRGKTWATICKE